MFASATYRIVVPVVPVAVGIIVVPLVVALGIIVVPLVLVAVGVEVGVAVVWPVAASAGWPPPTGSVGAWTAATAWSWSTATWTSPSPRPTCG